MNQKFLNPEECDIESFMKAVINVLEASFGAEYRFDIRRQLKNNSTYLSGIIINRDGDAVSPTVYVDDFFRSFIANRDFSAVADSIVKCCRDAVENPKFDIDELKEARPEIRSKIFFKLINAEKNKELVENAPHRVFMDLAVTCHRYVKMDGDALGSVLITNELASQLDLTEAELYSLAVRNTPRLFPLVLRPMAEMLAMLAGVSVDELPQELRTSDCYPLYVISNTRYTSGACCMLYPEFTRIVAEKMDSDFFVLPSSIHELIVVSAETAPGALLTMVREVNSTQVPPEDFLSDNIYRFCRATGDFEMLISDGMSVAV